jgi:hypothetical protein
MRSKFIFLMLVLFIVLISACSAAVTDPAGKEPETGTVSLKMYDAPIVISGMSVIQVCVNYEGIYIYRTNDETNVWITVVSNPGTISNLLDLTSNAPALLGTAFVPADIYTQIRIDISTNSNFVVWTSNYITNTNNLTIPDGTNSSVKITSIFEVLSDQTTQLELDFDAEQSIKEPSGLSENWKLVPVILLAKATNI